MIDFKNGPIFWKDIQAKITGNKEDGEAKIDLIRKELEEMTKMLELRPLIRHSVMGHYQDCKIRYKDLIAAAIGSKS